ncbi:hypothetical protein PFICI_14876 [Pestalotiopsis fici W106-1]|uniref:Uncharacterized protein n=1 Tax=Pestalotiopsis fici (strain W106-1 / CGMCC3.15140) TaxID=1229662 RepID=W3WKE1_PESFW|nr:uncharacterized protein PFICI_14876 [Pestalotiopsis fici W106-1]ETS73271.1 hypothetical protein PFICI_14876 [Pestalotiopsis fici W106-1]
MSHSPLARHVARSLLDKRAVFLCGYEQTVEDHLRQYSEAQKHITSKKVREKAKRVWVRERDIAYSAYFQLQQSQLKATKQSGKSAEVNLEDLALQPDCIQHSISPSASMTPREYHQADRLTKLSYDFTWRNKFLRVSLPQDNIAGFSRYDAINPGVVIVAESGSLKELRCRPSDTISTSGSSDVRPALESTRSSQIPVAQLDESVKALTGRRLKFLEIKKTKVKAGLAIVSAWDMDIPTLWDIRRRVEGLSYERMPKDPFLTDYPDLKNFQGTKCGTTVSIPMALRCSPYEIFQHPISEQLTWQEVYDKALAAQKRECSEEISKLDRPFVGPSFTQSPRREASVHEALAYCKRRKTLAQPFIKERNSYLAARVVKERAMSQQLTNAVELVLGFASYQRSFE